MTTRIAAFIWTLFIIVASLLPKGAMDNAGLIQIEGLDKLVHLCFYMFFVFLWSKLLSQKVGKVRGARIAFYLSIAVGCILELLQHTLDIGRHFELFDILANTIGSILGLTAFYKIIKL